MRKLNDIETKKILQILFEQTGHPPDHYEDLEWVERIIDLDDIAADPRYFMQRPIEDGGKFRKLLEDIKINGLKEPLIVAYYNIFLIDGYNRYQALKIQREKKVKVYHGVNPKRNAFYDHSRNVFI